MKRCPECRRDYFDDSLLYCLDDGSVLLDGPASEESSTVLYTASAAIPALDLQAVQNYPAGLSVQLQTNFSSPLIGRKKEITEITALLRSDETRLVTLTGIGGTGKTMLAKEIGRSMSEEFAAGVLLVELESVNDPAMVGAAIAHALGFNESGTKTISELLSLKLRDRAMLLILDNFEQVISAGVQLAALLRAAPRVKVLVTSQEPLRLSVESEYRVPPLSLPAFTPGESIADLMSVESVQFFVERAKRARPDFVLDEENAVIIASICNKLDGLPLALELAASRTRVLSPNEVLSKLDDRLGLLTGGSRDLPDRQRTIRAAIEWSSSLLSDDERDIFAKLAVFEGGFNFNAAEVVTACRLDILDLITSLTDKSLLMSKQGSGGEIRFWMLQIVRDFALEMLDEIGETERLHRSHADFFLGLVQKAAPHLFSLETAEWLDRLEVEHDNLRAALRWSLKHAPETAAKIAAPMAELWTMHGHIREAEHWFQKVLDRYDEKPTPLRWQLLTGLGIVKQFRGELSSAFDLYTEALDIARANNEKNQVAKSLRGVAAVEYIRSDFVAARQHTDEACEISKSINDEFGTAAALARLGDIALAEGDLENAAAPITESLEIFRRLGYMQGIAAKLSNLAAVEILRGYNERAEPLLRESLETSIEVGDITVARLVIDSVAALKTAAGDLADAARLCGYAEKLSGSLGIEGEPAEERLRKSYMEKLRSSMHEEEFAEAFAEGERMSLDEAARLALSQK